MSSQVPSDPPPAMDVPSAVQGDAPPPASEDEIRALVSAFEEHDFGGDDEFRAGLPAVMRSFKGKGASAAHIDDIIAKAQWFYFARKHGSSIPFDTYLRYRTGETESRPMRRASVSSPPKTSTSTSTAASASALPPPPHAEGISVTSPEVSTSALPPVGEDVPPLDANANASHDLPKSVSDRVAAAELGGLGGGVGVAGAAVGAGAATHTASSGALVTAASETRPDGVAPPVVETVAPGPEGSLPFDDVVRLIASGRAGEIPSVEVPEGLNTAPASESVQPVRAKPWERVGS